MSKELPKNVFLHPNGKLWVKKTYKKKILRRSLHTNDLKLAKARAEQYIKDFIAAIDTDVWGPIEKKSAKRQYATVGEVLPVFREFATLQGIKASSIQSYTSKLRRFLVKMCAAKWEDVSTDALTPEICDEFVERWILDRAEAIEDDAALRQDTVNMAQGELRNAAAIFGKKPRAFYRKRGLKLPAALADYGPSPNYPSTIKEYELPDVALIERTVKAGRQLTGTQWLVFVGCFDLACRGSDLANARVDWIKRDGDGWCLDIPKTHTKGKRGHRKPMPDTLHAAIMAEIGERETILPGDSLHIRRELVQRGLFTEWMRSLGWETQHLAHELRALKASFAYCHSKENGHLKAKQLLGHGSIATTEKYYADPRGIPTKLHHYFTTWEDLDLKLKATLLPNDKIERGR